MSGLRSVVCTAKVGWLRWWSFAFRAELGSPEFTTNVDEMATVSVNMHTRGPIVKRWGPTPRIAAWRGQRAMDRRQ